MKIINKTEFYKLNDGTLYSEYKPCAFFGLKIKQTTLNNYNGEPFDFIYEDLIGNVLCNNTDEFVTTLKEAEQESTSFKLDFDCTERDGLYKEEQLFAIYEREDIIELIKKLNSLWQFQEK